MKEFCDRLQYALITAGRKGKLVQQNTDFCLLPDYTYESIGCLSPDPRSAAPRYNNVPFALDSAYYQIEASPLQYEPLPTVNHW